MRKKILFLIAILMLSINGLGEVKECEIDSACTFYVTTHNNTGSNKDADSVPSYRIYEEETGTALTTGTMTLLDAANTNGFYSESFTPATAAGYEASKQYGLYICATVDSITGCTAKELYIVAAGHSVEDSNINLDDVETDTAAQDTSAELRTLLVGSDTALSTLTSSDNIGINLDDTSGTLGASEFGADFITSAKIADNAIAAEHIAANAITTSELATGCISADEIADNAIDAGALAANCIGSSEIGTGAIDADSIATDAIGSAELATGCIGTDEFAAEADNIGINWADVSNPTTALDLSGTVTKTVDTCSALTANNDKTGYTLSGFTASWVDSECTDATELAAERDLIKTNTSKEADRIITQGDSAWATGTGTSTHSAADVWTAGSRALSTPADYKADVSALATQINLTDGVVVLTSATETQFDNIETDTNEIQLNQTRLVTADISTLQTEANASTRYTNLLGNQTVIVEKLISIIGYVNDVTGGGVQTIYDWLVVDANIVQDAEITGLVTTAILNQNITAVIDQGDSAWATATGFQTEGDANTRYGVMVANATDIVEHGDASWSASASCPTNESIYEYFIAGTNENQFKASGYQTETNAGTRYNALVANATDIVEHGDSAWTGGASCPTNESIYEYFKTGNNEDVFKATGFQTETNANTRYGVVVANFTNVVEHGDASWTGGATCPTNESIYEYFITGSNEDQFKADVSALATTAILNQNVSSMMTHGDSTWNTASGFQTESNAATRYNVIVANATDIIEHGDSDWDTATGFETETSASTRYDNLKANMTDVVEHGDVSWSGGASCPTNESIYKYFTSGSNEDEFKASGYSTHSAVDVDTQLNSSHPGNWSATGTSTALSSEQNATLYEIVTDTNEIQLNQSAFITATGFATSGNATSIFDFVKFIYEDLVYGGGLGW